ncbi:hypothetical protein DKY63_29160 [Pseudomonas putida]|uniref:DNA-binding protein n=1 Tax=Pseudomonas putida TaxID=303 RepID=A0A2Z4RRX0_PSEPU|nr:hypothetical protein DKY63_29160 [Pseudomonas putida]
MIEAAFNNEEKRENIARALGFLTASELAILAGVKESTLEAWRKRSEGPTYVRLGNEPLYPLEGVRDFLVGRIKVNGRRHIVDAL